MTYFITFAFVVASILSTVVSIPVPEVDEVTLIKRGRVHMSPAVFSDIGDLDSGVTDVSWSFDN
ncbi:hypothetical protein C8Q75DRAFT_809179 [Abortiporus biennis]|nr:hypothetical protein C8Q75DRAFT_809179 [Abortiporus biennis]